MKKLWGWLFRRKKERSICHGLPTPDDVERAIRQCGYWDFESILKNSSKDKEGRREQPAQRQ